MVYEQDFRSISINFYVRAKFSSSLDIIYCEFIIYNFSETYIDNDLTFDILSYMYIIYDFIYFLKIKFNKNLKIIKFFFIYILIINIMKLFFNIF